MNKLTVWAIGLLCFSLTIHSSEIAKPSRKKTGSFPLRQSKTAQELPHVLACSLGTVGGCRTCKLHLELQEVREQTRTVRMKRRAHDR
ncbi:MAG: hypothetical protein WD055_01060 [Candidatus Dependentiae bacterium]